MTKRILIIMMIICWGNIFAGCWDRQEMENLAFVLGLGLDQGPQGKLLLTAQIAVPAKLGGKEDVTGGGGGQPTVVRTIQAETMGEAIRGLNLTSNREITLLHLKYIIIGEDLARAGFGKHVDFLTRNRELRRDIVMFVGKGQAAEVMNFKPGIENNPAQYLVDLANRFSITGLFVRVTLHDFLGVYETKSSQPILPLLEKVNIVPGKPLIPNRTLNGHKTEEGARIVGTAIFREDRLLGVLGPFETRAMLILTNRFQRGVITIYERPKRDNLVTLLLKGEKPVIRTSIRPDGRPLIEAKGVLEADIYDIQSNIDYTKPDNIRLLEKSAAQRLKTQMEKAIGIAQRKGVDAFVFGEQFRKNFTNWEEWRAYNWPEKFPRALVKVEVEVFIRRTGLTFEPGRIRG